MKNSALKLLAAGLFSVLFAASFVFAAEYTVKGNAPGSSNSIIINNNSSSTIKQGGSATINNDINAQAGTGGNSASGNNGDVNIVTGDANTRVNVTNLENLNFTKSGCCNAPSPTPKPNVTTKPGDPSDDDNDNNDTNPGNGKSDNGNGGGIGGGDVMGLSATPGDPNSEYVFYTLGFVCLSIGTALVKKGAITKI